MLFEAMVQFRKRERSNSEKQSYTGFLLNNDSLRVKDRFLEMVGLPLVPSTKEEVEEEEEEEEE